MIRKSIVLTGLTTAALLLNGCGGGSSDITVGTDTGVPNISGILTDSPVEGATYVCGEVEQKTDANGLFVCDKAPIVFYVGSVKLGEILQLPEDGYVTPQDLVGVSRDTYNEDVAKIAVFLQSLDNDGEIESTIELDKNLIERLKEEEVELLSLSQTSMIELLDQVGAMDIVPQEDALRHLQRHMEQLHIMTYEEIPQMPTEEDMGSGAAPHKPEEVGQHGRPDGTVMVPVDIPDEISLPGVTENTPTEMTVPDETGTTDETPIDTSTLTEETNTTDDTPDETVIPEDINTTTPGMTETTEKEPATTTPPSEEEAESTESHDAVLLDDAVKQAYLDVINEARSEGRECGEYGYFEAADPVTWSDELYTAAYEHSYDMAISNTFSHTGSGTQSDITAEALHPGEGSSVGERIEYNGYTNWRRYGENIAAGTSMDEAAEAMEGWLESPGHCKNIMNSDFKEVGMALYYHADSHYLHYWTQDFGTR